MEARKPFEAQIEPAQTVCQPSSGLDAEPNPESCVESRYSLGAQTLDNRLEAANEAVSSIDKSLPGLLRLFFHGKKTKLTREARAANEPVAPTPMAIEEELAKKQKEDELAKQMVDLHKLVLAYGANLKKHNSELGKGYYKDEAREIGEETFDSHVFARKEILQEGMRYVRFGDGLEAQRKKTWAESVVIQGLPDAENSSVDFAMLLPQYNLPVESIILEMFSLFSHLRKLFRAKPSAKEEATDVVETKSIETTQTDASYSKEVEHHQPMPAPTWALPLCGPLFNKFSLKNDTQNKTSYNNLKSTSTLCAPCIPEKDDLVIIDPPTTEDAPEADSRPVKEPLCDFEIQNEPGRRKFVMYLTEDIDETINAEGMMLIASLLGTLRNGVVGNAPINYSTRRSANLIKIRAARWADEVGKEADKLLKKEAVKVARIRRKAQEDKEVNGEEADSNDVK
ncbi:uncharacterized protein B0T23DRAFT_317781 [Neurospora hispaniola]|uniref:Uncharacterized protein n=1 Tax=Neurospora hispaniola TaxID=588809 RepID=A0AAJ0I807_9PEZI|nr:hypothetical protein B0T23DRAFT_317781 [Neurospora hispaniola]